MCSVVPRRPRRCTASNRFVGRIAAAPLSVVLPTLFLLTGLVLLLLILLLGIDSIALVAVGKDDSGDDGGGFGIGIGAGVRVKVGHSSSSAKTESELSECAYHLTAFDRSGHILPSLEDEAAAIESNSATVAATLYRNCPTSDKDLLNQLVALSAVPGNNPNAAAAVIAIGVGTSSGHDAASSTGGDAGTDANADSGVDNDDDGDDAEDYYVDFSKRLDNLGLVADAFLTPARLEWRIVAERFDDFDSDLETTAPSLADINGTTGGAATRRFTRMRMMKKKERPGKILYDPTVHLSTDVPSPESSSSFAEPFLAAHRTLQSTGMPVDLILLRVFDERLVALSDGLRSLQFPGLEGGGGEEEGEACTLNLSKNRGRMMINYGGIKDFLGALTATNSRWLAKAMGLGVPYAQVQPVQWAQTYEFDTCGADTVAAIDDEMGIVNGFECAFLPIWGGPCLRARHSPALMCMSQFDMGSLSHIVLPADGIPEEVCTASREQMPIGDEYNPHRNGPPQAFLDWCPQCLVFHRDTDRINLTVTPDLVTDPKLPMGFDQLKSVGNIADYVRKDTNIDTPTGGTAPCAMELSMECPDGNGDASPSRSCCYSDLTIAQNVLGSSSTSSKFNITSAKVQRPFLETVLSSYLTRFNRSTRRRIARARLPREDAMFATRQGWEAALATGQCATLHIRRGDNIDRCQRNPGSKYCTMDLSLSDYMSKAAPMLKELGGDASGGGARHVFIMTDDPDVANETMQSPWKEKGYIMEMISGHNQYSSLTYSEWDLFLESLYGAQFCRVFVGHHISTVAKLVFHRICLRYGECPMADDSGGHAPSVF